MTTDDIVRALAAKKPISADEHSGWLYCALCRAEEDDDGVVEHNPDCPWQLAVEWVAEQESAADEIIQASRDRPWS